MGSATIDFGATNVVVAFSSALPNTNYAAVAEITNNPALGGSTYLQISAKTTTSFTITLRSASTGGTRNAPAGGVNLN